MPAESAPRISKHVLDKRRSNRRQIIWTASLATITVLAMTVYDLRFRTYATFHAPEIGNHLITQATQLATLPNDYSSVTIAQGRVADSNDDAVTTAPVNLPQRQVDLLFDISQLTAANSAEVIDEINTALNAWERKSNIVSDAVLDTRTPPQISPQEFLDFVSALRSSEKMEYRANVLLNAQDTTNPLLAADAQTLAALRKQITAIVISTDSKNAAVDIASVDKLAVPFYVIAPNGVDSSRFLAEDLGKAKHYRGLIVEAAPEPQPAAVTAPTP